MFMPLLEGRLTGPPPLAISGDLTEMPNKSAGKKSKPRIPSVQKTIRSLLLQEKEKTLMSQSAAARKALVIVQKEPSSLSARAYLEIRNKILKGDLPIGMALSRRQLATELSISVPPVTEALQQLESEGLLESRPRVGTRVRVPTRQDVEDRSIVREALESQAARLFVERALRGEKEDLRQRGRQLDQLYASCENAAVDRDFLFSVNTYHLNFHLRIAECGRCPALRDAIEKEQVLIFYWLYDTAVQRRSLSSDYHARLADALASGTPEQADAAMRQHIRLGLEEVLAGLERLDGSTGAWRLKKHERIA
jgi:DNA-binding GntR family transcriptional regulator